MAILNPDKSFTWNGLKVYEYLLTNHNPNHIDMPSYSLPSKVVGITIHNTEWISTSANTTPAEQYTRATVNGNMNDVRVHFYVDDKCAWQNLPFTLSGWHAADGGGNGNRKTIAIECIMKGPSDSVSKKSEKNCAKLAAYLLNKYGLTVENGLYTHSHWMNIRDGKSGSIDYLNTAYNTRKNCPIYILPHWSSFKQMVADELKKLKGGKPDVMPTVSELYRVRKSWEDSKSQIGAYTNLEGAKSICKDGYFVFNKDGKIVYPVNNAVAATKKSIDVNYRVYVPSRWLGEITNCNDNDDNGYAGIENKAIRGITIAVAQGDLKYRVHSKGGGWLSWITDYNYNDWIKGCAGIRSKDIDGLQIQYENGNYAVKYRASNIGSQGYGNWVVSNSNEYAGTFGKSIDKIQIEIVEKK